MLSKTKVLLYALSGIFLGMFVGFFLLILLPLLPLSTENQVYKTLGINRTRVIGFLPYFLLQKADKNYSPYLTTLSYFALTIDSDGHIQKLVNPQQEEPAWTTLKISKSLQKQFNAALQNHEVLSLTVAQFDEATISALMQNPKMSADNLLSDVTPIMQKYGFSDLNIDIESFVKSDAAMQHSFATFLGKLQTNLDKNHLGTLTVDVAPIAFAKPRLTEPMLVGKIADYVIVMGYDFHNIASFVAGPVAPLYGAGENTELDVNTTIIQAKKEIPEDKLILGIPLYGYEWATLSQNPGSPVIPASGETASNRRITTSLANCPTCKEDVNISSTEKSIVYLDNKEPYYHQIFLLDTDTLSKRLTYTKEQSLEGVALWALGYEGNDLLSPLIPYKWTFRFN